MSTLQIFRCRNRPMREKYNNACLKNICVFRIGCEPWTSYNSLKVIIIRYSISIFQEAMVSGFQNKFSLYDKDFDGKRHSCPKQHNGIHWQCCSLNRIIVTSFTSWLLNTWKCHCTILDTVRASQDMRSIK